MARKVFISVLGFTNYSECIYTKDAYKSHSVRFIQEATLEYLLQQTEWTSNDVAYIMLTDGAEKANWMDNGHRNRVTGEIIACEGLQRIGIFINRYCFGHTDFLYRRNRIYHHHVF